MEDCCANLANRETRPVPMEQRELARRQTGATPGLTVCRVCNRRHFTLTVDPMVIGMRGQSLA
jgi:hypothetical protein